MIEKKPFERYDIKDEKQKDIISMRLNSEELKNLEYAKGLLNQPKTSTALKQVFLIGLDCLHDTKLSLPLKIISANWRKNYENTNQDVSKLNYVDENVE